MGSSAIAEAVDEALAQLVASGGHLADPDAVKALWITAARRRLIDEQRSAEVRHRAVAGGDEAAAAALAGSVRAEPVRLTDDERQWWRIREILGVLRGDQRVWAEAWYDRVLSASRASGGQPRGLPDALGWTPAKTKSVSRRARMRMAAFIEDRMSGAVCEEQRALMDDLILTRGQGPDVAPADPRHDAVLVHIAGCEACWSAWHARRRALLGRVRAVVGVPVDGLLIAGHTLALKLAGAGVAAHSQSHALLARVGVGGAAAAGGGAATVGGKATAVCVGVVCAATAGGELAGVLPPIVPDRPKEARTSAAESPKPRIKPARAARHSAAHDPTAAAKSVISKGSAAAAQQKAAAVSKPAREAPPKKVVRAAPGDLPLAGGGASENGAASSAAATSSSEASAPSATPAASSAAAAPTFSATSPASEPTSSPPPAPAPVEAKSTCAPGSLGC